MKYRLLLFALTVSIVPACGGGGGGGGGGEGTGGTPGGGALIVPGDQAPTVSIVRPIPGQTFTTGNSILFEAQASDSDGTVRQVDFFDGATRLGTIQGGPFLFTWTGAIEGSHILTAVATDNLGATATSAPVQVFVQQPGGGIPTVTPPPTGTLRGVFFADATHGWTVGDAGGIWSTGDGGSTWTKQESGTTAALRRIQFVNTRLGWTVGEGGTILRTIDGGAHWISSVSGTANDLTGLSFVDAAVGWVVSREGTIHKTINGGSTWTALDPGPTGSLGAVSFVSSAQGWAGGAEILSTLDGGASWTHKSAEFLSFTGISHIPFFQDGRFLSSTRGVFVGEHRGGDVIFTTLDGGSTYAVKEPHDNFASLHGVAFGDATHLWAVGTRGPFVSPPVATIMVSTDGGLNWIDQISPTPNALNGVWFINATTGWAVGEGGTVIRTVNGGARWDILTTGS